MAMLHCIRRLDRDTEVLFGVWRWRPTRSIRYYDIGVSRSAILTHVFEFIAASVVVIVLSAASRGASEDREKFDEE